MDKKCVHYAINDIDIDDSVLIKKFFNTKSKTKKLK